MDNVTLLLVEGASEEIVLRSILPKSIIVIGTEGDLFTKFDKVNSNMVERLDSFLRLPRIHDLFRYKNVVKIAYLIDTDGCFINKSKYKSHYSYPGFKYTSHNIIGQSVKQIDSRNKIKVENIEYLMSESKNFEIPFSLYYMSCNFDHVMFGVRNLNPKLKTINSYDLARSLRYGEITLEDILKHSGFEGSYEESWQHIREGDNSLSKCTNFNIFLRNMTLNKLDFGR